MKQYNNKPNAVGPILKSARLNKGYTRIDLSAKLELLGVSISGEELYRMESQHMIIKDFELLALCHILEVKLDDLKRSVLF